MKECEEGTAEGMLADEIKGRKGNSQKSSFISIFLMKFEARSPTKSERAV
jgi:hypothetical protein